MALQNEHHRVVLAYSQRHQVRSRLVGLFLQLGKGGASLLALVVGPQDSQPVGFLFRPCIHYVIGEVEVLGDDEFQVFVVILYRLEMSLFQKSFYHIV